MRPTAPAAGAALGLLLAWSVGCSARAPERHRSLPSQWLLEQRIGPDGTLPAAAVRRALDEARAAGIAADGPGSWVNRGPLNVGGRGTALAVDAVNPDRIWLGTAAAGVWETQDGGSSWSPRFDAQPTLSIGALASHPSQAGVVWVGTGEDNGGGYSFDGDGVYKTTDGGLTWQHQGLVETRRIGKIAVDPTDGNRVFVAAGGNWFVKDAHRGIYRSLDGGATWTKVLFVADDAGGIDLAIDPSNPNRIYAAMWQRYSSGTSWYIGGSQSGIWRSLDGGTTWSRLTAGLPTSAGRIGLAIAPSQPATVYACVIATTGRLQGIYRSTDSGDSWAKVSGSTAPFFFSSYSYYFSQIRVSPTTPTTIYCLDVNLLRSTNGGVSFTPIAGSVHVDWHDLRVEAGGRWLAATDGGFYRSLDGGGTWAHAASIPMTQLYDASIAITAPERRFAGAQDNYVQRTVTGGLSDWHPVLGGDGLQVEVDPTDAMRVYGESQYGNIQRSTDGGDTFVSAVSGIDPSERTNWSTPIALDPTIPTTLYTGAQRVYRSIDAAVSWVPISPDLTNGVPLGSPDVVDDPRWRNRFLDGTNHLENLVEGTITVVQASPVDAQVIWAGTDDGNVWVTENGGGTWSLRNPAGGAYWVTDLAPDPFERETAYLSVTGYRFGDRMPYVRVTRDLGASWDDLSAGLPQLPMNNVLADDEWRGRLFVASDTGVHRSDDGGGTWDTLRGGMPSLVVLELQKHGPDNTLWAATHARGLYSYDLAQLGPADGDGDGVDNNTDCALGDPGAFAPPGEVPELTVARGAGGEADLSWASLSGSAGSGTVYDLARGDLAMLAASGTGASTSLACAVVGTSATDPGVPAADAGYYYLVRGRNVCGIGTWGAGTGGSPRSSAACP